MILQTEILQAQADRILATLPSLGYVYDPNKTESYVQQQWNFFMKLTMDNWESIVFNYERSVAIATPNDNAALQAQRYEVIQTSILQDNQKDWVADEVLKIGQIRDYNNATYICVQAHTTQLGWEPPNVPALFTFKAAIDFGEIYPDWIQPTGAQDAYLIGDRVNHNGFNWESTNGANVWEPGVFGWTQI